jgi:hypothetical protein
VRNKRKMLIGRLQHAAAEAAIKSLFVDYFNDDEYLIAETRGDYLARYASSVRDICLIGLVDRVTGDRVCSTDLIGISDDAIEQSFEIMAYIEYCTQFRFRSGRYGIESRVEMPSGGYGFIDFWAIHKGDLWIVDLKTGSGSCYPDSQKMFDYLYGVEKNRFESGDWDSGSANLVIFQNGLPSCFEVPGGWSGANPSIRSGCRP